MSESPSRGEPRYLAVIGDIRGSRRLKDRAAVQARLEEALAEINREFAADLAADFVVTLGDEFQGLLREPHRLLPLLGYLETSLVEVGLRYGIGWGPLATPLRRQALGMDGPCFHRAREALSEAKHLKGWAAIKGFGIERDRVLGGLLALIGAVRGNWTRTQTETVGWMRRLGSQKQVAATRGVTKSTVSKALHGALYEAITRAEEAVAELLRAYSLEEEVRL